MKKKRIFLLGFLILIVLIFSLSYYNTLSLYAENILKMSVNQWGYYGIALSVFILEFVPQPFLSVLIPFTIGRLFDLNPYYLIVLSVIFSVIANYSSYFLGYTLGDKVARFMVTEENYNKSLSWFKKYGKKSLSVLALTPLPYFPVMGGIFKMTPWEFTIYGIIPRMMHFLIFLPLIMIFI